MYVVKPGIERVSYALAANDDIHTSSQPAEVANELIRRSDSYKVVGDSLRIDGGIIYRLSDLEMLA